MLLGNLGGRAVIKLKSNGGDVTEITMVARRGQISVGSLTFDWITGIQTTLDTTGYF